MATKNPTKTAGNKVPSVFNFWRENKVANHYTLTADELVEKFREYLKTKEKPWIERYYGQQSIFAFIGEKEPGLNSVHEFSENDEIYKALKPVFREFV